MTMPDDAPHVRGVAIYIPKLLETPTVSVQIVTNEGGARMMVTSLKINLDVSGYTQIAVAAQVIPPGTDAAGVHHCNIVAIGKPEVSGVSGPCF